MTLEQKKCQIVVSGEILISYEVSRPRRRKLKSIRKVQYQEKLSDRDLEKLMGVHRPRYYKHRGSYRQR